VRGRVGTGKGFDELPQPALSPLAQLRSLDTSQGTIISIYLRQKARATGAISCLLGRLALLRCSDGFTLGAPAVRVVRAGGLPLITTLRIGKTISAVVLLRMRCRVMSW
jgi:hypothetical protein